MERKNDKTIFLLIAAGLGIYWFMKNKATQPATTAVIAPSMPETAPILPITQDIVSTQPVYNEPVYQAPIMQNIVSTQPVYEAPIEATPITDMFNSFTTGGAYKEDKYK